MNQLCHRFSQTAPCDTLPGCPACWSLARKMRRWECALKNEKSRFLPQNKLFFKIRNKRHWHTLTAKFGCAACSGVGCATRTDRQTHTHTHTHTHRRTHRQGLGCGLVGACRPPGRGDRNILNTCKKSVCVCVGGGGMWACLFLFLFFFNFYVTSNTPTFWVEAHLLTGGEACFLLHF